MHEILESINIKDMIYEIRGKEVMLDSDLAKLYGCANGTKTINLAVKRNIERFPDNFYFRLNEDEYKLLKNNSLRFQFETLKKEENKIGKHKKYLPYVFTEQGIAMLSSVLRTKDAARVSVNIMNAFVEMRRFINENKNLFKRIIEIENDNSYIKNTLLEHNLKIDELFGKFDRKEDLKSKLFFNGEIYDAYSLIIDIISKANNNITIIDNFVDKVTLDILSKKKVNVIALIVTDENKNKLINMDIDKFNKEYPLLNVKYTNVFHDRFIIIDNKELYHLGTSINYIGSKIFAITKIDDDTIIKNLLSKINV